MSALTKILQDRHLVECHVRLTSVWLSPAFHWLEMVYRLLVTMAEGSVREILDRIAAVLLQNWSRLEDYDCIYGSVISLR